MDFLAKTAAIAWKDAVTELRAKEMFSAVFIFAFLVAVIFSFAFNPVEHDLTPVFSGIMWMAYLFAGTLGLHRSFVSERANEAIQGLSLIPGDRSAIFFGKFLANLGFMIIFEILLTPIFFALLNVGFRGGALFLAVLAVATVGFTAAGTFLSAMASHSRAAEVLLPILLFPLLIPVVIGAVRATDGLLAGDLGPALFWLKVLVAYDMVFVAVPLVLFEYLLEGS